MKKKIRYCLLTIFFLPLFPHVHAQKGNPMPDPTVEMDQGFLHGALGFVLTQDNKYVVAWSHSNALKVYLVKTGRLVKTLQEHHNFVTAVSVNPKTGVLISTDADGKVIEWTDELKVKKRSASSSLIIPLDSRGYVDLYGNGIENLPFLKYDSKYKNFEYVQDVLSGGLSTEIPIGDYDSDTENWLNSSEVNVFSMDMFSVCEYTHPYYHIFNTESVRKKEFLKLKPLLKKKLGMTYHNVWTMQEAGQYIVGDLPSSEKTRKKYTLDPKYNLYPGFQRISDRDTLSVPMLDTNGFSYVTGSVYKPVLVLRKKQNLKWIDLSNFNIKSFTVDQDHAKWETPLLDSSCSLISVPHIAPRGHKWKTLNIFTGEIFNDSLVVEVPNVLGKKLYARPTDYYDWSATSHEAYLKDWFNNKIVHKYHFSGIDDGPIQYFLDEVSVDQYYKLGKCIPLISENEFVCPDLEGHLVLFDYPSEKIKKRFKAQGISLQIGIVPGTSLFFSQNSEGNVFFYDKNDKQGSSYTAALYATGNGLCIINRENFYFAYGRLDNDLFFNLDNNVFPFEQFDLKFNRPDKVLQTFGCKDTALITSFHKAYLKRLKKMNFTEEMLQSDFHLPEINIKSADRLPGSTENAVLELDLQMNDAKYKLDRVNVYINNVPVYGSNGLDLKNDNTQNTERKVQLVLAAGQNKVQVSVLNQAGAESYKKELYITYKAAVAKKPDLYLVTIGCSQYKDSRFDLTYAAKDAEDISETFRGNSSYGQVFTYTYTNRDVTRPNIMELKKQLLKANRDDVIVITVAGHGVLDKELNYFVATYDMDFNNPGEKGIPYEELESLVDGIAPLRKVIFLDACHSGEVDKDEVQQLATSLNENSSIKFRAAGAGIQKKTLGLKTTSELMNELFTDLRKGTGATVVSSAGGVEYAMESSQWKNGLFTYCLLHGLQDMAADLDKNGQTMLSELQQYLRQEVVRLSNGAQQPNSRIQNISMDFRIW